MLHQKFPDAYRNLPLELVAVRSPQFVFLVLFLTNSLISGKIETSAAGGGNWLNLQPLAKQKVLDNAGNQ
ncbi:MAG: hypothetical protein V7L02_03715 [Nostoc sp.]|uniref:hypothetical protein n=1 Tax=Nostoc sp. TaxID=1180 RepID=UPI002FF5AE0E